MYGIFRRILIKIGNSNIVKCSIIRVIKAQANNTAFFLFQKTYKYKFKIRPPPENICQMSQMNFRRFFIMKENKREILTFEDEFSVRKEIVENVERYFIRFFTVRDDEEVEVNFDTYLLYRKIFTKPLKKNENDLYRRLHKLGLDDALNKNMYKYKVSIEDDLIQKSEMEEILNIVKTCTATQQRRFNLYFLEGYNYSEIAKIEKCDVSAIIRSVNIVKGKIKLAKNSEF